MFYSETLLSKTGPLARVWLSANLERKLSKTHILQSSIENSVNAIVDQGQAPMALRLSATLTVMDQISDPLLPELDPSLLDFKPMDVDFGSRKDDPLNWTSQLLSDPMSIEVGRDRPEERPEYGDSDMDIDLDLDVDDGPSIEIGRNAPTPRPLEDNLFADGGKLRGEPGVTFDFGDEDALRSRPGSAVPSLEPDEDPIVPHGNLNLDDDEMFALPVDDTTAPLGAAADPTLQRDSQSPLSSVRSSVERTYDAFEMGKEDEEPSVHQPQKAKKRKVLQSDVQTMMSHAEIKRQQADRSSILKPASYLSKDPLLLNLLALQQNGGFVSNIMGDGRTRGWAPELRGILSVEVIRKSNQLKRKRDDEIRDDTEDNDHELQLEIPKDDTFLFPEEVNGPGVDNENRRASETLHLPADDEVEAPLVNGDAEVVGREEDEERLSPSRDDFDITTAPLLHPLEQGAVSLGTQHAVHLLRERFGSSTDSSQPPAKKTNIVFQNMLPEATTSKADATKMFFEVLVLATKDAVKVDQSEQQLGGPMRIRGKRGLWGAWAENQAGGEIAEQEPGRIFLLKFAKPDCREQVIVESGFRCHLTSFSRATASAPSPFITKLRKYLRTRRVTSVSQVGTDRIVELQFSDGQYRLFLEFYAGGNIVLTDRELNILSLLRVVPPGTGQEELRSGLKYALENRQNYGSVRQWTDESVRAALRRTLDEGGDDGAPRSKNKKKASGDPLRKALAGSIGEFPASLIDRVLGSAGFETGRPIADVLSDETLVNCLVKAMQEAQQIVQQVSTGQSSKGYIIAKIKSRPGNTMVEDDEANAVAGTIASHESVMYEDFQPFKPLEPDPSQWKTIELESFNKTVDEFFSSIEGQRLESRLTEKELNAKRKIETARHDYKKRIDGLQQVQEINIRKAQAIEANLQRVQEVIGAVNGLISQGMDWVEIARLIEMEQAKNNVVADMIKIPLKLYENTITVLLAEETFDDEDFSGNTTDSPASDSEDETRAPLEKAGFTYAIDRRLAIDIDLSLSPWSNARQYYDQKKTAASKEQKTLQSSVKALKSTEKKINADLKKGLKHEKQVLRPVRKQLWFEKFHYFVSSEGYLVLAGKDAQQNEILYKRHLKNGDAYVHADIHGAASVIIKNKPGRRHDAIPPSTLSQAGTFTVATSSAWDSKAVMSAWWVRPDQVSKTASTGDYLTTGSFFVRGEKNFLPPARLLLGFGILFQVSQHSMARHLKHRLKDGDPETPVDRQASVSPNRHALGEDESPADDMTEEHVQASAESDEDDADGMIQPTSDDDEVHKSTLDYDSGTENNNPLVSKRSIGSDNESNESRQMNVSTIATADDKTLGIFDDEQNEWSQEAMANAVDTISRSNDTSGVRHIPARDRRLLRRGQSPLKATEDLFEPEQDDGRQDVATSTTSVTNEVSTGISQGSHVRGKYGKRAKLKTKYAHQDEEDRALALRLLGSAAAQGVREDSVAKAAKEDELAAQKNRRRQQHLAAAERGREEERARRLHLEEGVETLDQTEAEGLEELEAYIGMPFAGDEILDALVVCGPWDAIGTRCKWRVKMQPGSVKKGKAVREILADWMKTIQDGERKKRPGAGEGNEDMIEEEKVRRREGDLLRGLREQEVVGTVPVGKVRVVTGAAGSGVKGKGGGGPGKGKRGGRGSKRQR
ncbi:MAG: hypothetical protein Q9174_000924 [Haloplaca sp. 1 TL-2023]